MFLQPNQCCYDSGRKLSKKNTLIWQGRHFQMAISWTFAAAKILNGFHPLSHPSLAAHFFVLWIFRDSCHPQNGWVSGKPLKEGRGTFLIWNMLSQIFCILNGHFSLKFWSWIQFPLSKIQKKPCKFTLINAYARKIHNKILKQGVGGKGRLDFFRKFIKFCEHGLL